MDENKPGASSNPGPKPGGQTQAAGDTSKKAGELSLLDRAKLKAPHLDQEFVSKHDLPDEYLEAVANGSEPPPPYNGPDTSATDLHFTPGGWQTTPAGVKPEDVGKDAIRRDS